MSEPLNHLRYTKVRVEDATRQLDVARTERDAAIREAIEAGHPAVRVAEAAGVSKQGLYNALARTDATAG